MSEMNNRDQILDSFALQSTAQFVNRPDRQGGPRWERDSRPNESCVFRVFWKNKTYENG